MGEPMNPYAGTDLYRLVRGTILLGRLRDAGLAEDGAMVWVLPPTELPGVTAAWAVPIVRAPVSGLYLAHRVGDA